MKCWAITKGRGRCRRSTKFLLCSTHRKHLLIATLSLLTFVGLISGIFRDLVEPLFLAKPNAGAAVSDRREGLSEIRIPIQLESTWDTDTRLDSTARIFLTKPGDGEREDVTYSAVARVEVPEGGATQNDDIWIPAYSTTNTVAILPRSQELSNAIQNGGYSLRIVLKNKHGHTFTHMKTILLDERAVYNPVRFWLRLDFEQIPHQ